MADEVKADKKHSKMHLGKRLAARVLRTWVEDFVDEDTGEVVVHQNVTRWCWKGYRSR